MERWGKEGMKWWKWRREWKEEEVCVSVTICCLYNTPRAQSRFTLLSFQRHASWSSLLENLLTSPHNRWHHTVVCSSASGNMSGLKRCHYSGDIIRLSEFFFSFEFSQNKYEIQDLKEEPVVAVSAWFKKHHMVMFWENDVCWAQWLYLARCYNCNLSLSILPLYGVMGGKVTCFGASWHWVSLSREHLLFGCISLCRLERSIARVVVY